MIFIKYQLLIFLIQYCCTMMFIVSASITLTVSPSPYFEVNQTATFRCALDPNPNLPVIVSFISGLNIRNTLCVLEPYNGTCKNTPGSQTCLTRYNASCLNETVFSIHLNVPQSWNGTSIYCQSVYSTSNYINFSVRGI